MRLFPDYPERITRIRYPEPVRERLKEVKGALNEMGSIAETAYTALSIDFDQMREIREQHAIGVSEPMPVMPA